MRLARRKIIFPTTASVEYRRQPISIRSQRICDDSDSQTNGSLNGLLLSNGGEVRDSPAKGEGHLLNNVMPKLKCLATSDLSRDGVWG